MTTERDKCGLGSLLPMSCRGRAEAFARHLHSRLRSLGNHEENGVVDETSWLASDHDIAVSQPRTSTEQEGFLDFCDVGSPASPEEKLEDAIEKLLNNNMNHMHLIQNSSKDCHCSSELKDDVRYQLPNAESFRSLSCESDSSDGPYYDTDEKLTNGHECMTIMEMTTPTTMITTNGDDSDAFLEGCQMISESCLTDNEDSFITPDWTKSDETLTINSPDDYYSLDINESLLENDEEIAKTSEVTTIENRENDCVDEIDNCKIDNSLNKIVEDDEDEFVEKIPQVRRCSSLKTGKTPPGTPSRKKIVRFADVLGLDLADVRTFLDDIPKIPTSAYSDLTDADISDDGSDGTTNFRDQSNHKFHGIKVDKILVPLFQQPGGLPNFLDRVRDNSVCLENAVVEDPVVLSVSGTVRVRNLDFHKSVHIRFTLNSWKSFADVQGIYVANSCDGFTDTFKFLLYVHTLTVGQRLEFAVRFQCKGVQYWDNNNGANYCFQCLPASTNTPYLPITHDSWGASFY